MFWPITFRLPQEHAALVDWYAANPGAILAIKPNDLFGGRGITVTRALPPEDASGCVAQRYVDPPALIDGHKFHIRLYILITSAVPTRAWLWGEGIVRLAPEPYATDDAALARPAAHITNTALHLGHPALHVADDANAEDVGHVRGLSAVLRRLHPQPAARAQAWEDLRTLARRFIACVAEFRCVRGAGARASALEFPARAVRAGRAGRSRRPLLAAGSAAQPLDDWQRAAQPAEC